MNKLEVRIFLDQPSSCGCCGLSRQQNSSLTRCVSFIKNLKSRFGERVDVETVLLNPDELEKYPAISELRARKNLKAPVVLVNNVVRSIGRYPSEEEMDMWQER
ncbi:MAG: arsenic metallochaperone ArsD family protein [Candidatus Methanoperedens sp.]|nr:arsenic metallochaperone ArsD family protein [Candidatus Methanoperedens sp.]